MHWKIDTYCNQTSCVSTSEGSFGAPRNTPFWTETSKRMLDMEVDNVADMMLDREVDKGVHMDGGLRMMDGKWLSACGSCDLEDKFMGPEGPPSI